MLTLLTPSKTMDFATAAPPFVVGTEPHFLREATRLRRVVAGYDAPAICRLMKVSDSIASRVIAMYEDTTLKPALWTYSGDVFKGFQVAGLDNKGADFANDHLLIASAVYGLLRPSDMISPYRLEMRAKLPVQSYVNLYDYWGVSLARLVQARAGDRGEVCVLLSREYAKAALLGLPESTCIVTPAFMDIKPDGKRAQIPIYNKMMRGVMARWIVDRRIDEIRRLNEFTAHGYAYDSETSTGQRPVFLRKIMSPLKL